MSGPHVRLGRITAIPHTIKTGIAALKAAFLLSKGNAMA